MTWGAINEWTTQAGYSRLAKLAGHPTLSELLRRIMKQEERHIDFYAAQAGRRLADSRAAQRLTRWALRRFWAPVGTGVVPDREVVSSCGDLPLRGRRRPGRWPIASIAGSTASPAWPDLGLLPAGRWHRPPDPVSGRAAPPPPAGGPETRI